MTSCDGNMFRITGFMWEAPPVYSPHEGPASDAELWSSLSCVLQKTVEQSTEQPVDLRHHEAHVTSL